MVSNKSNFIGFRINPEMKKEIKQICSQSGASISSYIKITLSNHLKDVGKTSK